MAKKINEYVVELQHYNQTPKAVYAAIALSMCYLDVEERGFDAAETRLMAEWRALHEAGIIPQAPCR